MIFILWGIPEGVQVCPLFIPVQRSSTGEKGKIYPGVDCQVKLTPRVNFKCKSILVWGLFEGLV